MKKDRFRRDQSSPKRAGARRRAAQADVANYIHELSDRHGLGAPAVQLAQAAAPAQRDDA